MGGPDLYFPRFKLVWYFILISFHLHTLQRKEPWSFPLQEPGPLEDAPMTQFGATHPAVDTAKAFWHTLAFHTKPFI